MTRSRDIDPIDLTGLTTVSIADRKSLVNTRDFARPWEPGGGFSDFLDRLPAILAGADLRGLIAAVADAHLGERSVILAMGAHVIKVGLSPVIIDLMERGIITAVALNGAGIIHDYELALTGTTSEDVAGGLSDGRFGVTRETGEGLAAAIRLAGAEEIGLGRAVGRSIREAGPTWEQASILAAGDRLGIPVTVHVAIGTDVIHLHPDFPPGLAGAASHLDFRIFASAVATLTDGVYLNVGSAVILPEVFLKALTLVRNRGHRVERFTAANLDFIRHYRPLTNVVARPTAAGGRGYNLVGHHEILIPLLAAGVIERIASKAGPRGPAT